MQNVAFAKKRCSINVSKIFDYYRAGKMQVIWSVILSGEEGERKY